MMYDDEDKAQGEMWDNLVAERDRYKAALEEIAEWPRNPEGPNYSIKYIAKQALKDKT